MADAVSYFAYGSNLDRERLEDRVGPVRGAVPARLSNYRLAFNKRADGGGVYANVMPAPGGAVWGVAYLCSSAALARLDRHEGVRGGHYQRQPVEVESAEGERLGAIMYVAGVSFTGPESTPHRNYLAHILTGARAHALPADYIEFVEQLAFQGAASINHLEADAQSSSCAIG